MTTTACTGTALDRYRTVTVDGETFHVARYGWPVETCYRCGGTGRYSWCEMYGDKCFQCAGGGVSSAAGKASDVKAEYQAEVDRQARKVGHTLEVGDEFRGWDDPAGTPFLMVADVTPTSRECGRAKIGDAPWKIDYYQLVTTDDGETREMANVLLRGRVHIDRSAYTARAQAAMAAKIKRQRAVAARPASAPRPRKPRANQYPGACGSCGQQVAKDAGTWSKTEGVRHADGTCPA